MRAEDAIAAMRDELLAAARESLETGAAIDGSDLFFRLWGKARELEAALGGEAEEPEEGGCTIL